METLKSRILVVDDDWLGRIKLSILLEQEGCKVIVAENGAQALQRLRTESFDTVLLDLLMPVMDGFEVLHHVREDPLLARIPFIVITGEDDLSSVVRCIEMGAADYLTKPFNAVLLRARLASCLEKKRFQDRETTFFDELKRRHEEIQELHQKIEQQADLLRELSIRDGLTALYNRRHFDEQGHSALAQAQRYNQPLTLMIGDIDFFKRINDRFSHAVGDEVLRRVARILQSQTRESDIAARYGGEEFVLAFPHTSLAQAIPLCEKLRQHIESHAWQEIHPELRVSMSMGLNDDTQAASFEKMLAAADALLYRAKENGRNRVCASGYGVA